MNATTEDIVAHVRQWSIDRIHFLSDFEGSDSAEVYLNAMAIASEYDEWIYADDSSAELEVLSLNCPD